MQVWFKKVFLLPFLFLLVLIPISLAIPPFSDDVAGVFAEGLIIDYPHFNYHKENSVFELNIHVYNISTGFLVDNTSTSCEGHLYNSTGEEVYHIERALTHSPHKEEFVFSINDSSMVEIGFYGWSIHCNTSYLGGYASGNFIVTETGEEETTPNSEDELLLYFVLALIIILLFVGFYKDDHNLVAISGMLMVILGGYIIAFGFSTLTNTLSTTLGIIFIAVGIYFFLRSSIENF